MSTTAIALTDILGPASVIDGDTIEIHGRRIRLHGIDAPESKQTCRTDGEQWRCGQKASLALADKIGRSPLRCEQSDLDHYGRIVATCYLGDEVLNPWLVANGWALAYRKYSHDYVAEELAARERRKGVWRGEFVVPWDWRLGSRLGVHPRTAEPPEPSVSKEPVDPPAAQ